MGAHDGTQGREFYTELTGSIGDDGGSAFDLKGAGVDQITASSNTGTEKTPKIQEEDDDCQPGLENGGARPSKPAVDRNWPSEVLQTREGPQSISAFYEDGPPIVNVDKAQSSTLEPVTSKPSVLVLVTKRCLTKSSSVDRQFWRITDDSGNLGSFLQGKLFRLAQSPCDSCGERGNAHVYSYSHHRGEISVTVKKVDAPLSEEGYGKMWMWHTCGRCPLVDGGSPKIPRARMSEADLELPLRKFFELSFSTHEKLIKPAACGHSLGRDCIRFYSSEDLVARFEFAEASTEISVFSIYPPPLTLEQNCPLHCEWLHVEVDEVINLRNSIFAEVQDKLQSLQNQVCDARTLRASVTCDEAKRSILSLEELLIVERNIFEEGLTRATSTGGSGQSSADVLELNWHRRQLFMYAARCNLRLKFLTSQVLTTAQIRTNSGDDEAVDAPISLMVTPGHPTAVLVVNDPKVEEELSRKIDEIALSHTPALRIRQSSQHKDASAKAENERDQTSFGDENVDANPMSKGLSSSETSRSLDGNREASQLALEIDLSLCYGEPLHQHGPAHQSTRTSSIKSAWSTSASERFTAATTFIDSETKRELLSHGGNESMSSFDIHGSSTNTANPGPVEENVTSYRALSAGQDPLLADLGSAGVESLRQDGRSTVEGGDQNHELRGDSLDSSIFRDGNGASSPSEEGNLTRKSSSTDSSPRGDRASTLREDAITDDQAPSSAGTAAERDESENKTVEGWMKVFFDKVFKSNRRASSSRAIDQEEVFLPPKHSSIVQEAAALARGRGPRLFLPGGHDGFVVAIYDDEPTTLIAFALISDDHHTYVTSENEKHCLESDEPEESDPDVAVAHALHRLESFPEMDNGSVSDESFGSNHPSFARIQSLENLLIFGESGEMAKVAISFADETPQANAKFQVTCYFAKQFDQLRKKCCMGSKDFIRSLCRCKKWDAQGGKSKAFFAKTADERYIVKQLSKTELTSFVDLAPTYFKYLCDALTADNPTCLTCLAKILGVYEVKIVKDGKERKMDILIMENLFYGRAPSRVYDLKGSMRSRYNADTGKDQVLLDENLDEMRRKSPIYVSNDAKHILERAIWTDTYFLSQGNVMDYSLLVGVDEEKQQLVVGIIDIMRRYTWDKQLESWVKAAGILGGPKNAAPTVISPKQYKKRFRDAIRKYFLTVPDDWPSPPEAGPRSTSRSTSTEEDAGDIVGHGRQVSTD